MNVLIVHPHMAFYGGAETLVVNLARELKDLGVESSVLTLSLSNEVANLCREITFITPPKSCSLKLQNTNLLGSLKRLSDEITTLRRLVKEHAPGFDVINVHNFPATWSMLFTGCKNVTWMCNEPPDLWNKESPSLLLKILRNVGYHVDKLIVNSVVQKICVADDINARRIRTRYEKDVEIVPYGIEYDLFSKGAREPVLKKYNLEGKFIIVQVGTITPQKNQLESVKTIDLLKSRIPNISLLLVGPGNNDYQDSIMNYIEENNMEDYVLFLGDKTKKEIADIYHACHVALFPVKFQGGWLAPFEAICASKPVVVSETMGAASIIKKEGLGVATLNYADAIFDIYQNPHIYKERATKGKEWVCKNLTWFNFSKRKCQVFESLLQKDGGR